MMTREICTVSSLHPAVEICAVVSWCTAQAGTTRVSECEWGVLCVCVHLLGPSNCLPRSSLSSESPHAKPTVFSWVSGRLKQYIFILKPQKPPSLSQNNKSTTCWSEHRRKVCYSCTPNRHYFVSCVNASQVSRWSWTHSVNSCTEICHLLVCNQTTPDSSLVEAASGIMKRDRAVFRHGTAFFACLKARCYWSQIVCSLRGCVQGGKTKCPLCQCGSHVPLLLATCVFRGLGLLEMEGFKVIASCGSVSCQRRGHTRTNELPVAAGLEFIKSWIDQLSWDILMG